MIKKSIFLLISLIPLSTELFAAIQPSAKPVGAPLDGGLLTILAASGIAYFIGRNKKKDLKN